MILNIINNFIIKYFNFIKIKKLMNILDIFYNINLIISKNFLYIIIYKIVFLDISYIKT